MEETGGREMLADEEHGEGEVSVPVETTTTTTTTPFGISEELLSALPSDPFEQLDVARKITSIALSARISALESEVSSLRAALAEKDGVIADLASQLDSLSDASDRLAQAELDNEKLSKENASLSGTVRKLQRDVSKLEVFRKTLMQSLQEDEESPAGAKKIIAKPTPSEDESGLASSRSSSFRSDVSVSDLRNSIPEDRENGAYRPSMSQSFLLASQTSTPRLTPPGSPPSLSASASPTRTSKPASPRRHSMSFSTSRGLLDDRSSIFSSVPSSQSSSERRSRMDGKEFFRQVRSRLSYEQFGAFLANVKELNSHKQTKEETLRKADEIFGADNKDLFVIFEGLFTRNAH